MRIIGCDLHARQQTLSMLDAETREVEEHVGHEGEEVRESYSGCQVRCELGLKLVCATQWFLQLMEELGVERWVGHPSRSLEIANKWRKSQCAKTVRASGRRH